MPEPLTPFEQKVSRYFDSTAENRSWETWDPDHLHFGLFDPRLMTDYETDPERVHTDRTPAIAAMTRRIVEPASIGPGDRVVDAGCGFGGTALLATTWGARVTGVNFNEAQLQAAREKARERGLEDRCDFVWANCSVALPFDDASVDVVINIESACHYADRKTFAAEVARILKPGGRVAACDYVVRGALSPEEQHDIDDLCAAWYLGPPLESLASYRDLWAAVGLQTVQAEWLGAEARPNGLLAEHRWHQTRSFPDFLLGERQKERREQMRTFSKTFLEGSLGLGVYLAVKGEIPPKLRSEPAEPHASAPDLRTSTPEF